MLNNLTFPLIALILTLACSSPSTAQNRPSTNLSAEEMFRLGATASEKENYNEAAQWFMKAADLGHAGAINNLASFYLYGNGVPQNIPRAIALLHKAVDLSDTDAMTTLGNLYLNGVGVGKDIQEAIRLYNKAFGLGDGFAAFSLGKLYSQGTVIERDIPKAVGFFKKGMTFNDSWAAFSVVGLGDVYIEGLQGADRVEEGVRLYRQAADSGLPLAMTRLGGYYDDTGNRQEAIKWYRAAARNTTDGLSAKNAKEWLLKNGIEP